MTRKSGGTSGRSRFLSLAGGALALLSGLLAACGGGGGGGGGGGDGGGAPAAPTVVSVSPASGATGVSKTTAVTANFSLAMNAITLTGSTFRVATTIGGTLVPGAVSSSGSATSATFTPSAALSEGMSYTATLTTGVKSTDGVALAADYSWSFTVAAATPADAASEDSLLKAYGVAGPPPMSVVPERPLSGQNVTATVTAFGATSVTVTVEGPGCGTLAGSTGASPLVLTGASAADGYCDLHATATFAGGVTKTLAGHFEVQATAPDLPPLAPDGGVFENRPFPAAKEGGPSIVSVDGPPSFINGSSVTYNVAYNGPEDIKSALIQVPGYDGYYRVPVTASAGSLTFTIHYASDYFTPRSPTPRRAAFRRASLESPLDLLVALDDALGAVSEQFSLSLTPQQVNVGEVKVSIAWNTPTDVDLHVTEPGGETINYGHTRSAAGGHLDMDSNAACNIDNKNNENIYWPEGQAPNGDYSVTVRMYRSPCGTPPGPDGASGTLTVTYCGNDSPQVVPFTLGSRGSEFTYSFKSTCGLRVSGKATYEDFPVTDAGLGASAMVPVRFAKVQVMRASDDYILADGNTDTAGKYDITFVNDKPDDPGFYVRVLAQQNNDALRQVVQDLDGNIYAFRTPKEGEDALDGSNPPDDGEGFKVDVEVKKADGAGALNIFDVGLDSALYAWSHTGRTAPSVIFKWTDGQRPLGTNASFYRPVVDTIYILGDPADSDCYDDVVIAHEYGHFVMQKYSVGNSGGGQHSSNQRSAPPLAWSEGWATFFACASQARSSYADTDSAGMGVFYSIETLPATKPLGNTGNKLEGGLSEAVVASVLIDLFDSSNESNDTLSDKSTAIWTVFTSYLANGYTNYADRGAAGRDLVDFLDGWFCLGYGDAGEDDAHGVRGIVKTLHGLSYDFPELATCR